MNWNMSAADISGHVNGAEAPFMQQYARATAEAAGAMGRLVILI